MSFTKLSLLFSLLISATFFFSSCDKNTTTPATTASKLVGTYSGTAQISGDTTIQNATNYSVTVSEVNATRIKVESAHFQTFETEIMSVSSTITNTVSDPTQLSYVSLIDQLTIQRTIGNNSFQYTGTK